MLDVGCFGAECSVPDSSCPWGNGLPALAADGRTLVVDEQRGDGNRTVRFIDVATSKVVESVTIVNADVVMDRDTTLPSPAEYARIEKRIARLQKRLDAGGYRALVPVPSPEEAPHGGVRAEFSSQRAAIRLVDDEAHLVLWQERFPVRRAYPARKISENDRSFAPCYPDSTRAIDTFWDPRTHLVLAQVWYAAGPCFCADVIRYYVRRAAEP